MNKVETGSGIWFARSREPEFLRFRFDNLEILIAPELREAVRGGGFAELGRRVEAETLKAERNPRGRRSVDPFSYRRINSYFVSEIGQVLGVPVVAKKANFRKGRREFWKMRQLYEDQFQCLSPKQQSVLSINPVYGYVGLMHGGRLHQYVFSRKIEGELLSDGGLTYRGGVLGRVLGVGKHRKKLSPELPQALAEAFGLEERVDLLESDLGWTAFRGALNGLGLWADDVHSSNLIRRYGPEEHYVLFDQGFRAEEGDVGGLGFEDILTSAGGKVSG